MQPFFPSPEASGLGILQVSWPELSHPSLPRPIFLCLARLVATLARKTGRLLFVAVAALRQVSDGKINYSKAFHTWPLNDFYHMLAAADDGCVEVAKCLLESR